MRRSGIATRSGSTATSPRGNLLVRDGRIHAVIDFGSIGVGDPACDLVDRVGSVRPHDAPGVSRRGRASTTRRGIGAAGGRCAPRSGRSRTTCTPTRRWSPRPGTSSPRCSQRRPEQGGSASSPGNVTPPRHDDAMTAILLAAVLVAARRPRRRGRRSGDAPPTHGRADRRAVPPAARRGAVAGGVRARRGDPRRARAVRRPQPARRWAPRSPPRRPSSTRRRR